MRRYFNVTEDYRCIYCKNIFPKHIIAFNIGSVITAYEYYLHVHEPEEDVLQTVMDWTNIDYRTLSNMKKGKSKRGIYEKAFQYIYDSYRDLFDHINIKKIPIKNLVIPAKARKRFYGSESKQIRNVGGEYVFIQEDFSHMEDEKITSILTELEKEMN